MELDRLIGVFDAALSHVDKWYASLLLKLTNGVLKFSNDLFLAHRTRCLASVGMERAEFTRTLDMGQILFHVTRECAAFP